MNPETRTQLRDLANGDSYAAFKSAAMACGLSSEEAEQFWECTGEVVLDVRDCGAELRAGGAAWLTSTAVDVVRR